MTVDDLIVRLHELARIDPNVHHHDVRVNGFNIASVDPDCCALEMLVPGLDALTIATNRLGNAVGALIDAGTWCEGPHDVTAGIERLGAEIERLRRERGLFAAAVAWRADWMTRAVNVLGELRDTPDYDEGRPMWAAVNDLLAEEYGDDTEGDPT